MNNPEIFEKVKTVVSVLVDEHVPIMIKKLKWHRFDNILDYGCGSGSVTSRYIYPLAEKYYSAVTAVDLSPEMIEYATRRFPNPRVTFIVGDIMGDKDLSCNYEEFLVRLCDQLQEGGQLALSVPFGGRFYKIHHDLSDHPKWGIFLAATKHTRASWPYDEDLNFPQSLSSILLSREMTIMDLKAYETTYSFADLDAFIDFIMATNIGMKNVPTNLQHELRQEIGSQGSILANIPPTAKPFTVKLNYLRCIAEK